MSNILKYPKKDFTKKEVIKEKKQMQYPELWKYSTTKTQHKLKFMPSRAKK